MADPNPVRVRTTVTANPPLQDRPIIFSAPMVRALLDGRKTMTRRMAWVLRTSQFGKEGSMPTKDLRPSQWQGVKPGDRLWVREAWRSWRWNDGVKPREFVAQWGKNDPRRYVGYVADGDIRRPHAGGEIEMDGKVRVAIHLPRWASRLTLVVSAVRVERLQAITDADAIAEGLWSRPADFDPRILLWHWEPEGGRVVRAAGWAIPIGAFCNLWERLHGRESWFANPDVVALTFAVHPRNIDQMPA